MNSTLNKDMEDVKDNLFKLSDYDLDNLDITNICEVIDIVKELIIDSDALLNSIDDSEGEHNLKYAELENKISELENELENIS